MLRRYNSTVTGLYNQWRTGQAITGDIAHAIRVSQLDQEEGASHLEALHSLVKAVDAPTRNQLLEHGLPYDFSLYYSAKDHEWSAPSLASLLRANPGRVFQTVDLFEKHKSNSNVSHEVKAVLAEKLLVGEKYMSDEYQVSVDAVAKAIGLVNELGDAPAVFEKLIAALAALGVDTPEVFGSIRNEHFAAYLRSRLGDLEGQSFVAAFAVVFDAVSKEHLCKYLDIQYLEVPSTVNQQNVEELRTRMDLLPQPVPNVLAHIEQNKLDVDKSPESLLLRMKLVEVYGMDTDNIQKALDKFHQYQTHAKFGLEFVQHKMVQSFVYQAFKHNNDTYMKIAESLVPENIPIKLLQALILGHATNENKSLDIYNEYINHVSQKLNPDTRRSPSGLLTESLMVASLLQNDREFAQLLFDKACLNGILLDELEIATVKKVFRVYGDAFVDDSWESARNHLHSHVTRLLRRL